MINATIELVKSTLLDFDDLGVVVGTDGAPVGGEEVPLFGEWVVESVAFPAGFKVEFSFFPLLWRTFLGSLEFDCELVFFGNCFCRVQDRRKVTQMRKRSI